MWDLRGLPVPPLPQRRIESGEPATPEQAVLRLLDSHAAALAALTVRSPADFRTLPVLPSSRTQFLIAALLDDTGLAPSLLESLAVLITPRLARIRHRLRRRLGRLRVEVPLAAVREMDASSLRHNTRRPGRTLIEKAGAKQTLRAVVRVERFDTMENRVLAAACHAMRNEALERLEHIPREQRRTISRAVPLHRLANATGLILALPELAGVTRPRPGERPSFALMKDPDYRAIYRAQQLLRAREDWFAEEWRDVESVWRELLLMIVWAVIDVALPGAAVPSWVRPLDQRIDGSRLQGSVSRRWLRFDSDCVEEWQVEPREDGLWIKHCLWSESDADAEEIPVLFPLGTRPADRRVRVQIQDTLRAVGVSSAVRVAPLASEETENHYSVALSALNPIILKCDGATPTDCGTTVVGTLGAGSDEGQLPVYGRPAAFLRDGILGPHRLNRDHMESLGQLLGGCIDINAATPSLAVVIPDGTTELSMRDLRHSLGSCWLVWHTVAVALSSAEQHPSLYEHTDAQQEQRVLVLALSAASCDVAVLGASGCNASDRLFVRRLGFRLSLPGMEAALLESAQCERGSDALLAAWLRTPEQPRLWVEQAGDRASFRRYDTPDWTSTLAGHLDGPLRQLLIQAEPVDLVLLSGVSPMLRSKLAGVLPNAPCVELAANAAVTGAYQFLVRHGQGLPTWEDELPSLHAQVRQAGRRRLDVELISGGQRVRPGQHLSFLSSQELNIPPGERAFDLPLRQGTDNGTSFLLHYAGRPLPLRHKTGIQVFIDYRYGVEGLRGELRATSPAPFARIPFVLRPPSAADPAMEQGSTYIPEYLAPAPPSDSKIEEIKDAFGKLRQFLKQTSAAERRAAKKNPGVLAPKLKPLIRRLDDSLKMVSGSGPASMSQTLRTLLSEDVGPFLEWLADMARSKEDGEAPALTAEDEQRVRMARSRTRVRGSRNGGCFASHLVASLNRAHHVKETLMAIGNVIDGQPDDLWETLVSTTTQNNPEYFRGQAWAMRRALISHPDLALRILPEQAERALDVLRDGLLGLRVEDAKMRSHFAIAVHAIRHLCRCRQVRLLLPGSESVRRTISTLEELRPRIAEETLRHAETVAGDDELLAGTIEALEGREVVLVFKEQELS